MSGCHLAPLKIGGSVERRHLGSIGHMLASSLTLEEMLNGYVYYESLFYGRNIANVRRNDGGLELYWAQRSIPENYGRFAMSSFAAAVEHMGVPRSSIESVSFPFCDDGNRQIYLDEIGCAKIHFNRELGLHFAQSSLHLSLRANEENDAKLTMIKALMSELSDVSFAERLYDEIVSALPQRQARLGFIANRMAMSERTLQRRLAECNDGLRGVINRIRLQQACVYLEDAGMSLLAVSLLLGYSEQSALQLAFKRFYGVSPGQWRRENAQQVA